MAYLVDERDVEFALFEWLDLATLFKYDDYREQSIDLYKMVLSEALKFARNELEPLNKVGDRVGCKIENGKVTTPPGFKALYKKFAENGFVSVDVPTTYGGQDLPMGLCSIVTEFFSGANQAFCMYGGLTRGVAQVIETFFPPEKARHFCPKMYSGEWTGTMCLTEAGAGSAVGDLKTRAKKNADGTYNITGSKLFISGGEHDMADNIIHMVLARVEGDPAGTKGISLFVVPKIWINPDGSVGAPNDVTCVNIEHKMGICGSCTCLLNYGENGKCRAYLIGEQREGMKIMFRLMNDARLLVGIQGLGIGGAAYEAAVAYAKDRVQGGNTHIIDYPDVRRSLVTCRALVEGMRGMVAYTGKQIDISHKSKDPAEKQRALNRADLLTPICKAYCTDMGFRITEIAMQVYGGYGYIKEYPIEQYMRDVKIGSLYEGTNGIQALDLIGRKLALRNGELFREFYEDLTAFTDEHEGHSVLGADVAEFKKAIDSVGQAAMKFAEWGMGGDRITPQLGATAFLEMCGHTMVAWVLLSQAVVAQKKIDGGVKEPFYANKVKTAKFFVNNLLPQVSMNAKVILTGDKNAMEISF